MKQETIDKYLKLVASIPLSVLELSVSKQAEYLEVPRTTLRSAWKYVNSLSEDVLEEEELVDNEYEVGFPKYTITPSFVVVFFTPDEQHVIKAEDDEVGYSVAKVCIVEENWEELKLLLDAKSKYIEVFKDDRITFDGNRIIFNGVDVTYLSTISERIRDMAHEGGNYSGYVNFLERVIKNQSMSAASELMQFLEHCSLPITPEGMILAYKSVDKDFLDQHSRTIDNTPGAEIPRIERNEVDDDRRNKCSYGYHFCSQGYLNSIMLSNSKLLIVEVDPVDVVAVPEDYDFAKARCMHYKVLKCIPQNERIEDHYTTFTGAEIMEEWIEPEIEDEDEAEWPEVSE